MESVEVKKRGRKKKIIKENPLNEQQESKKPMSKRGRKAKTVEFKKKEDVEIIKPKLKETFILHLDINLEDLLAENCFNKQDFEDNILNEPPVNLFENTERHEEPGKKEQNDIVQDNKVRDNKNIYNSIDEKGRDEIIEVYDTKTLPTQEDENGIHKIRAVKTDVACWWCCHTFDNLPVCAPLDYDGRYSFFKVVGCFCSFNCSKAYIMKEFKSDTSMISFLFKKLNSKMEYIEPAPPRIVLKMFGGDISIEEYRESFHSLSKIQVNLYPMVFIPSQTQHHKVIDNIKKCSDKMKESKIKNENNKISENIFKKASKKKIIKKSEIENNNLINIMGIKIVR